MKNKKLIINFLANVVKFGLPAVINFFLSPYIVNSAGEAAYGFVSLATNFTTYAAIITVAINSMTGRFVMVSTVRGEDKKANQYFASSFFSNVIIGVFFAILGTLIVIKLDKLLEIPLELISDVKTLFALCFIAFIINTLGSVFEIGFFVTNNLYLSSGCSIVTAVIRALLIAIMFTLLPANIYYMGVGTLVVSLISIIYNFYMSKKLMPFVEIKKKFFKFSAIKEVTAAGVWNSINSLGTTLTEGLDLLMCNIFLTPSLMGILSLSKTIPMMLKSVHSSIVSIFAPEIVERYARGDTLAMKQYLKMSIRIMRMILCVPFGVFIGLAEAFYSVWLPGLDSKMLGLLSFLSISGTAFSICVSPVFNVFTAANKMRIPSLVHLSSGVISFVVVLVLLNTTNLGVYAVAGVSTIVGTLNTLFILLPFAAKLIHEKKTFFVSSAFSSAITVAIVSLPGMLLEHLITIDTWGRLITVGVIYALTAYLIVIMTGLTSQERIIMKNKIFATIRKKHGENLLHNK